MGKNKQNTVMIARSLRKKMTRSEGLLWTYLNNRGMCGFKFRRQYPFHGFVIDFYCPEKRLGIELDGGIHKCQKEYDKQRQQIIEREKVRLLRFENESVLQDMESVLRTIKKFLIPSPPKSGEGKASRQTAGEQG